MRTICLIAFIGVLTTAAFAAAEAPPVNLMPAVSEVQWGEAAELQGSACVLLSGQAGPSDRAAAELLARYVDRRFGLQLPNVAANNTPEDAKLRIYLGQPKTFPELDRLCREQKLTVPEQEDGYALKVWSQGGKITAIVAGMNVRAMFYGQDTLFQLITKRGDKLTVQGATIRDWPTIPLRGRPHPHYQYYLKTDNFDCMMTSRINFIDLRDGIYAFEPGAKLPKDDLAKIIKNARDRGLRIYAAVNCGVSADKQDAVIGTLKEFIEMGADALWASFDDKGAGADPTGMVSRIIALGKQHNITGDAIAITPPKGDYQTIKTKFNREVVAVPGMEKAVWYWTSIPCAEDVADGESIGLKVKPSWWHNWPRLPHPSLSGGGAYVPVVNLNEGWNRPNDLEQKEMGKYVLAIMPWDGWQYEQYYLVPTLGWWSWRPEKHEFSDVRRRIYDLVFGPDQTKIAAAFDDELNAIQDRFIYWSTQTDFAPQCPPRLKCLGDRDKIVAGLKGLQGKVATMREPAMATSVLDRKMLQKEYLDAMAREVEAGLIQAQIAYPEYWYPDEQSRILNAIYADDTAKAEQLIAGVRERLLKEVAEVKQTLGKLGIGGGYVEWWNRRANATVADWKALIEKRQAELQERVAEYDRTVAPTKEMLSTMDDPPVQIGTGLWERHNHVLATVMPEAKETFWGEWIGGVHEKGDLKAAVFALAKHMPVNAHTFCQLPVNIPVSGRRDRLALVIYLADANKESFGLGRAKWRWSGTRALKVMWEDKELWKADLGIPRLTGEWFVVPLPKLPDDLKTLSLQLRLEDYHSTKNNLEIVYVGPIRLLELDRD